MEKGGEGDIWWFVEEEGVEGDGLFESILGRLGKRTEEWRDKREGQEGEKREEEQRGRGEGEKRGREKGEEGKLVSRQMMLNVWSGRVMKL